MEKNVLEEQPRELEILEFKAGGNTYGIDVSLINEILPYNKKPTPVPNAHTLIEGIIMPRDFLITIIDLVKSLNLMDVDDFKNEMLIVTNIYNMNIAFHVDSVIGINRASTADISKPGKKLSTTVKEAVAGVYSNGDKKVEIIDFKKIIDDINPNLG